MVSGLASSIRAATESTTFDLAGHDAASIRSVVNDAFSEPLSLANMIRITFVVGGGKLSRSRYDDKAMQAVTATLKQMDYVEDRGASCILECAGCFKTQHDTSKNVITVVVFPTVADDVANESGGSGGRNQTDEEDEPLIPTNSPGYKMAVCSQQTFQNLLSTYCPTYLEKKECLGCFEGLLQLEQAIENKLMNGHPLDSAEQSFYDVSSDLKEKLAYAQKETGKHVEEGRLTSDEKAMLVEMNEKKIETLMSEKSSASVAEKLKKALARKKQLRSLSDGGLLSDPPPLRCESQLTALRKKLLPLQALEESSKGRLLTLSETRSLTEKGEIEQEVERLEVASCGWFEEEDSYQERLQKSRETFKSKYSRSKRGGGGKTAARAAGMGDGSANPVTKWLLPGEKPKSAWGASKLGKKKLKGKGGSVFSAMLMDSSSDEEEESDEESVESEREEESYATLPPKKQHGASNLEKKKLKGKGGAMFSAMMDSSSDEEEESDEESAYATLQPKKQHTAAFNVVTAKKGAASSAKKSNNPVPARGNSNSIKKETTNVGKPADTTAGSMPQTKKKKKKNKKKSKPTEPEQEEIQEVEETIIESKNAPSTDETPSSVSDSLLQFWRSFLLPLILFLWRSVLLPLVMFIVSLLVSLVTSMFGGKNSKKGDKKKRG